MKNALHVRADRPEADSASLRPADSRNRGPHRRSPRPTASFRFHFGLALVAAAFSLAQAETPYDGVGSQIPFDPLNALDIGDYCNGSDELDDSPGINAWLTEARHQGKDLYVSPGTWCYSQNQFLGSGVRMQGAGPDLSIFKNLSGTPGLFTFSSEWDTTIVEPFTNISFEDLGFDLNGAAGGNFIHVIGIVGRRHPATHLTVRRNKIFDSVLQDTMYTDPGLQRQYIVLINVEDVLIEDNDLSGGGRIKAGSPGLRIVIRNNRLHNINDNGITIANNRGANVTQHVLIEGNTIVNPLSSGIFFGSDGEQGGVREQAVYDITIRNNSIRGDFAGAGIWGMMPDHSQRIYIQGNSVCKTGDTGPWAVGIGFSRSDSSFHVTQDVMVKDNQVTTVPPGTFRELSAFYIRGEMDNFCLIENEVSPVPTALFVTGPIMANLLGNEFHGGGIRLENGAGIDSTGNVSDCFEPTDLPVSVAPGHTAGVVPPRMWIGPNPFGRTVHVGFLDNSRPATLSSLSLFDVSGRLRARLVAPASSAGPYAYRFEIGRLPAGVYLARVTAGKDRWDCRIVHLE